MSSLSVPLLQGSRCVLRALTLADAPSLRQHADDEAVSRNLYDGFPSPYTLADAQSWCDSATRPDNFGYVWGVDVQGHIVGCVGVRPDDAWFRCNAEIGYWLGQAFWGRGLASEGLSLASNWVWSNLPEITRLYAPIFAWNEGSQAVARRCGYFKEAELRRSAIKGGRVIDRVQWACLRPVPSPLTTANIAA